MDNQHIENSNKAIYSRFKMMSLESIKIYMKDSLQHLNTIMLIINAFTKYRQDSFSVNLQNKIDGSFVKHYIINLL